VLRLWIGISQVLVGIVSFCPVVFVPHPIAQRRDGEPVREPVDFASFAAGDVDERLRDRASEVVTRRDGAHELRVVGFQAAQRARNLGSVRLDALGEEILRKQVVVCDQPDADLAQGAKVPSRRAARHLEEALVRVVARLDGRGGAQVSDELAAQLDSARNIEAVPAPEGGPPATFVEAVEQGLEAAETEAGRRLSKLVDQAKDRAAAERDASLERLTRWLLQSKAKPAQREKILEEEARFHDAAIAALDGATLELDQVALVQLL